MITCELKFEEDIEELYRLFESDTLSSKRASCRITKGKDLVFKIEAKDPVSMKAFLNSILKVVQTYRKIKEVK